jgi:hypothetical protein
MRNVFPSCGKPFAGLSVSFRKGEAFSQRNRYGDPCNEIFETVARGKGVGRGGVESSATTAREYRGCRY